MPRGGIDLYDRIIFKAEYEFAPSLTEFTDVYVGMKGLGPVGTVRFGHIKEPFSLEEMTSDNEITFMERALATVFDSSRNFGVIAHNQVLRKRMTWAVGIFAPTNKHGKIFSTDTNGKWCFGFFTYKRNRW